MQEIVIYHGPFERGCYDFLSTPLFWEKIIPITVTVILCIYVYGLIKEKTWFRKIFK